MALVEFTKNAAGPPFAGDKVSFGPYNVGDVVDLAAGSITKLGADATKTVVDATKKANKHTASY